MSTIIYSDKRYTGSLRLPNIIDSLDTAASKINFINTKLSNTQKLADDKALAVFDKAKAHRLRVNNDGGQVISLVSVIKALAFAESNNLSATMFSAHSTGFGVKVVSSGKVIKSYGISGIDLHQSVSDVNHAVMRDLEVYTAPGSSEMVADTPLVAGSSLILGSCMADYGITSNNPYVSAPKLYTEVTKSNDVVTPVGTSTAWMSANKGNTTDSYYLDYTATDNSIKNLFESASATSGVYRFAWDGLVGMIDSSSGISLYRNGSVSKTDTSSLAKNLAGSNLYLALQFFTVTYGGINEFWVINSSSTEIAKNLSVHLNKN